MEHGSLYPALHRLEKRGWLESEWKVSEANRRARYYKLTPKGKRELIEEQSHWRLLVRAVARTMKSELFNPMTYSYSRSTVPDRVKTNRKSAMEARPKLGSASRRRNLIKRSWR